MTFSITPGYAEFFDDRPRFEELIEGIPTKMILLYGSYINAELYNNYLDVKKQGDLFVFLTRLFPLELRLTMLQKIQTFAKGKKQPVIIFARIFTVEFMHRALLISNDGTEEDTTPDQEIRLLKAYLLVIDELNESIEKKVFQESDSSNPRLKCRSFVWPMLAHQSEMNHDLSPHFQSIKLVAFLAFLAEHPIYYPYLKMYLDHIQQPAPLTYVVNLFTFLDSSFKKGGNEKFIQRFAFIQPAQPIALLNDLSINHKEYRSQIELHKNYKGLKEKPLYEYRPNIYFPLSYGMFFNKLYNGFVFDFYKHSGLNQEPGYDTFGNFKSKYSGEFSESKIFRTILKEVFCHKHTVVEFSDKDGMPDGYVRMNNTIFLFEFKDYLFADEIATAGSYDKIKKDIDLKFVFNQKGKPKGIRQLLNQISHLERNCFQFDDFIQKGLKRKNMTIYPVIVHTNHIYTMPDVNDYLSDEFNSNKQAGAFKIKDVVLVDLETIFIFLQNFQQDKHAFKELLNLHYLEKKKLVVRFNQRPSVDTYTRAYGSFEQTVYRANLKQHSLRYPAFMQKMFESLEIKFPVSTDAGSVLNKQVT